MLDNIREWISDNLRYILLVLAVIILIIIAFFAVRLVTHIGRSENKQTVKIEETEEETDEDAVVPASEETLVKDQEDILAIATSYWTAIGDQDFDTLETLCGKTFDDDARATVESMDVAVEAYDGIITYSKSGLTDGSYVVYVYMDLKLTGIETEAPALRQMYLEPDEDGGLLVIQTADYTDEIRAYTEERQTDSDVQALIKDVNDTLSERCETDEDLKQYIDSRSTSSSDSEEETDSGESTAALGTMQVSADSSVNVRSEASTDGTIYGALAPGEEVEVLENLDNGWSRITYENSSGSTIEGYMMTQYLTAAD